MSSKLGLGRLWRALTATLRRRRFEREMANEMAHHLELRVQDLVQQGVGPEEAQRQARLEFGGLEGHKEACREARRLDFGDELLRNVRHALRVLRRSPGLSCAVVATLGLGIGLNLAVYSALDIALLRPLPYPEPERLAAVQMRVLRDGQIVRQQRSQNGETWQALARGVSMLNLAVYSDWGLGVNVVSGDRALYLQQQRVGAGFFRVLGVPPHLGREFSPEEDLPGGPARVVLSHRLWQRLYAGDSNVLGRSLQLKGEPHEIVGVMPQGFRTQTEADLWTPLRPSTRGEGEGTNYSIVGRLQPGVGWPAADAEVQAVARAVQTLRAPAGAELHIGVEPLQQGLGREQGNSLWLAWAVVWLVLAVACVNVGGLLLAHGARRHQEMATRMALGSGRAAVLRQLITESLVLSLLGAAVGVLVALLGMRWIGEHAAAYLGLWQPMVLDARLLAAALLIALITVLLAGLYPAFRLAASGVLSLRGLGRQVAGSLHSRQRSALVVVQLAVVMALLVGAGLAVRSLQHLQGLAPGFDPQGLVSATVSLQDARYSTAAEVHRLLEKVAQRLRREPDIEAVAAALSLPYERPLNMGFALPGDDPDSGETPPRIMNLSYVTPGFFQALGIEGLRGRFFSSADSADSAPVLVVNQAFVRTYLEGLDPIGQRIDTAGIERTIVGVVADVQHRPGWGGSEPLATRAAAYMPVAQTSDDFLQVVHGWFQPSWVMRPRGPGVAMEDRLRRVLLSVDPQLPLARVRGLDLVRDQVLSGQRFLALLMSGAAAVSLLLAAVGLAGLIASSVADRQRELGIRMALGSTLLAAVRAAALPGLRLSLLGLALGVPLALAGVRAMGAFVYGVGLFDPQTYVWVATLLMLVAAIASLVPALRVLRLDPALTLRAE